ncbi:hypothetical protein [Thalassotalea fusca]
MFNKRIAALVSVILITACQPSSPSQTTAVVSPVDTEVFQARKNNDFRVYGTSGRNITIPGISSEDRSFAVEQCGIKFMKGTGDVIKTPEQRQERKEKVAYMKSYNQRIFVLCKQKKA